VFVKRKIALSFLLLSCALVLAISVSSIRREQRQAAQTLLVNNNVLNIEIANTPQEREHGLCCRKLLPANAGMLFVYDMPGDYHYWMKDTLIPLDMYWIDASKTIIHIESNVPPASYPKIFGASSPALYVLETNAGYAAKHKIQVGSRVSF